MSDEQCSPTASLLEGEFKFEKMQVEHLFALEPQGSQLLQYGVPVDDLPWSQAQAIADEPATWAAVRGKTVLACMGITESFVGKQGTAFGLFSQAITPRDWVPLTDFAREHIIKASPLTRVEAIVRCEDIPDWINEEPCPKIRSCVMLEWASREATPQVRWAMKVGLEPACVLRAYGAASEDHMLLERVLP